MAKLAINGGEPLLSERLGTEWPLCDEAERRNLMEVLESRKWTRGSHDPPEEGKVYQFRGVPLVCTFHPSALLRDDSGQYKRDCWEDMKLLLRTMGRPVPEVKRS